MIDTAILVYPRDDIPEASLLDLDVAGLPLAVRSLLTARHAGFGRMVVVASPVQREAAQQSLASESRLHGCVTWAVASGEFESVAARSVVMVPAVVLRADDLLAWRQRADVTDDSVVSAGSDVGPWAVPCTLLSTFVHAARDGVESLQRFARRLCEERRLRVVPCGAAGPEVIRFPGDVTRVERRMLRAQRSADDGPIVDRFVNRALSAPITRLVVRWPVTPNQVSLLSLLTGLLGAWLLTRDDAGSTLCGLLLFQLSVVLDHVDGEIARLTFRFSRLGKWLDNFGDHAVDLAVIMGVAWRVAAAGAAGSVAALAAAAAVGVTGSFLVAFWWSLRGGGGSVNAKSRRSAETLTSMANRDGFCLALWATLLAGRPDWFLWILAIGSNIYWCAWLVVCGRPTRADRAA